jgi:hypothetical protein
MKTVWKTLAVGLFTFCFMAGGASAQILSNSQSIPLQLVGPESLNLTCTPPGGVTFAAAPGTTVAGNVPISCLLAWSLNVTRTQLYLVSGVANAASALVNGAVSIPSSSLSISYNGGPANPCTTTPAVGGTGIGAGGGCGQSPNLLSTNYNSSQTITLGAELQEPAALQAGTYTGDLLVIAVAQ